MQRVQKSAACLVFEESKFCHITPLLRALHWLPVAYRIVFKMLLLTFKAIHKLAPTYTSEHVSELMYLTLGVDNVYDQMTATLLNIPSCKSFTNSVIDLFIRLPQNYGTIFSFLLEINLQLMVLKRLLKVICYRRHFSANL